MTSGAPSGVSLGIYEKALVSPDADHPDWESFFAQAKQGGFSFVDISVDETEDRAARLDWTEAQRQACRDGARAAGVKIGGICLSLHRKVMPGSVDPDMRNQALEVYRKGIQLAVDLGVAVIQVAGYYAHYEPDDPQARERYIQTLAEALPVAAREGVVLAIENVDGHDIASIPDAIAVIEQLDSPWLQCYPDVGNVAEHGGDALEELRAGEGRMVAIHVKDVLPGEPRRIPFGTGVADFDTAFQELARQQWSGRMMLEMWNDDKDDSVQTCIEARRFIEKKLAAANIAVVD